MRGINTGQRPQMPGPKTIDELDAVPVCVVQSSSVLQSVVQSVLMCASSFERLTPCFSQALATRIRRMLRAGAKSAVYVWIILQCSADCCVSRLY